MIPPPSALGSPPHSEALTLSAVDPLLHDIHLSARSGAGEIYSPASVIYATSLGGRGSAVTLGFRPLFVFSLQHLRSSAW